MDLARCLTAKSSSPQTSETGAESRAADGADRAIGLFRLAAVLVNSIQHLAHVFDLFEERIGDVDGTFLSGGQREAIAGTGIDFDNFTGEFVLLLEDEAGKISGVLQLSNYDPLDGDAETFEDTLNEIVGQGPFFRGVA